MQNEKEYALLEQIKNEINQVFVGKEEVVENTLICLLAKGHMFTSFALL